MMSMKKDLIWSLAAGIIAGIFLRPVVQNLGLKLPYLNILLFLILPVASTAWIFLIKKLFPAKVSIFQFAKFAVTGGLNASIDFGVLNILIILSGISEGFYFSLYKALSFIIANLNSYFWNKRWTFEGRSQLQAREYLKFLVVSLGGLVINVGVASAVVNLIEPQFGFSPAVWANFGALAASLAGLLWNFVGYKFIVFAGSKVR
mgnify:CR=1 FL=1